MYYITFVFNLQVNRIVFLNNTICGRFSEASSVISLFTNRNPALQIK